MAQLLEELRPIGCLINAALIEWHDYQSFRIGHGSRRAQVAGRK